MDLSLAGWGGRGHTGRAKHGARRACAAWGAQGMRSMGTAKAGARELRAAEVHARGPIGGSVLAGGAPYAVDPEKFVRLLAWVR